MVELPVSVGFVLGLMVLGAWLERINGKHGFFDELLTPLPLGVFGIINAVLMDRVMI